MPAARDGDAGERNATARAADRRRRLHAESVAQRRRAVTEQRQCARALTVVGQRLHRSAEGLLVAGVGIEQAAPQRDGARTVALPQQVPCPLQAKLPPPGLQPRAGVTKPVVERLVAAAIEPVQRCAVTVRFDAQRAQRQPAGIAPVEGHAQVAQAEELAAQVAPACRCVETGLQQGRQPLSRAWAIHRQQGQQGHGLAQAQIHRGVVTSQCHGSEEMQCEHGACRWRECAR